MTKSLITFALILFSATTFAADRFNLEQRNTRYRSGGLVAPTPTPGTSGISRYRSVTPTPATPTIPEPEIVSSFNQNARSGYTTSSKSSSYTKYNDGSYKTESKLTPNTARIKEYNSLTKTYRHAIKTNYSGGKYTIKYSDGSIETINIFGEDSIKVEQKDNLGNARTGIQNDKNTRFNDGFIKRSYEIGSGIRTDETGKK